jgi:hypothetical protein
MNREIKFMIYFWEILLRLTAWASLAIIWEIYLSEINILNYFVGIVVFSVLTVVADILPNR